jgi:hypothetical protein
MLMLLMYKEWLVETFLEWVRACTDVLLFVTSIFELCVCRCCV